MMTSPDDISMGFSARGRRVTALPTRGVKGDTRATRVRSCDHQILRPSRSRDDKAVLAARVAEI